MPQSAMTSPGTGTALPPLILVGSQSRAGQAIVKAWPSANLIGVHRGTGAGVRVTDYADVPEELIQPGSVVVNCVGTPNGSEEALFKLNQNVALRWAEAAAAAGASHFIQLSSFSVYGRVEEIDFDTPEVPDTAYGRSKLAADQALLQFSRPDFVVTLLRIPMLFGTETSKLAQLVRAVRKARVVPGLARPVTRSMLGYAGLAAAITTLARSPVQGVVNASDPTPFTYELLQERVEIATGLTIRRLPLPGIVCEALRLIAPSLHARLFKSSRLSPSAAYAFDLDSESGLEAEIARLART